MPKNEFHSEQDSPFYRLRSKKKLAELLFTSEKKLKQLCTGSHYSTFMKSKKDGTGRKIDAPHENLKRVQKRIADLLQRIEPPDYLFAPVSGRSYVDNAAAHKGARSVRLLDIEDFFPNCKKNRVIWFFNKRLECSIDVAKILADILTKDECLPQGSPCSPILAYFSYVDMWEEIANLAKENNCKLSIYADDLTISGDHIPENMVWKIKTVLKRFGHNYKKEKERSIRDKPADITGVILKGHALLLPNRQHKKLSDMKLIFKKEKAPEQKNSLLRKINGRISQKKQIEKYNTNKK